MVYDVIKLFVFCNDDIVVFINCIGFFLLFFRKLGCDELIIDDE